MTSHSRRTPQGDIVSSRITVSSHAEEGVMDAAVTHAECIDHRYRWTSACQVWQNSAIRTGLYPGTSPLVRQVGT